MSRGHRTRKSQDLEPREKLTNGSSWVSDDGAWTLSWALHPNRGLEAKSSPATGPPALTQRLVWPMLGLFRPDGDVMTFPAPFSLLL